MPNGTLKEGQTKDEFEESDRKLIEGLQIKLCYCPGPMENNPTFFSFLG